MKKIISAKEAASLIPDNSTVMIGGFLSCGAPDKVVEELANQGKKNLTLILNDTSYPNKDKGMLIANKCAKKAITAHIGMNPMTGEQMNKGELEVEIVPMGTLVEKIHAYGAGLGGVLTPTGVGTILEENKKVVEINGKKFLFEEPLGAEFALIYGTKVDKYGNASFYGTTKNFNVTMASAAKTVIIQADEICEALDPNEVTIPGIFIDYIVLREEN